MADEPPFDSMADDAARAEVAAWREYRGRQGHPSRARWAAAMAVLESDDDAMDRWREMLVLEL